MASKRDYIIEQASTVIHSKGFQNSRLEDILVSAGIGKGQFYHYFKNKHDLGVNVIDHHIDTWEREVFSRILDQSVATPDRLNRMFDWIVLYHESGNLDRGCPFGNLAIEMSEHDEEIRVKIDDFFQEWMHHLDHVLDELKQEGHSIRIVGVPNVSEWIISSLEGAILLAKNQKNKKVLLNMITTLKTQLNLLN